MAIVGVAMAIDSILRPKDSQKKDMHGLLQWMTYFELTKQTDIMKMRRIKRYRW